jgi:hypothetical protein
MNTWAARANRAKEGWREEGIRRNQSFNSQLCPGKEAPKHNTAALSGGGFC